MACARERSFAARRAAYLRRRPMRTKERVLMKSNKSERFELVATVARIGMSLLALLACSTVAWGQATTSVRGTVTDPSGSVVAGATAILANADSRTERTTTTGGQGEYQFLFVPPGTYALTVT